MRIRTITLACLALLLSSPALPQSISGGTISGTVKDPSGAAVPGASVRLRNAVTAYEQSVVSDAAGDYRFTNIPLNKYQLAVSASGFAPVAQAIDVPNTVPLENDVVLTMAEVTTSVIVEAAAAMVVTSRARIPMPTPPSFPNCRRSIPGPA